MMYLWKWFLAWTRLSKSAVCEISRDCGYWNDYHDYTDTINKIPIHEAVLRCERCGKEFTI